MTKKNIKQRRQGKKIKLKIQFYKISNLFSFVFFTLKLV